MIALLIASFAVQLPHFCKNEAIEVENEYIELIIPPPKRWYFCVKEININRLFIKKTVKL